MPLVFIYTDAYSTGSRQGVFPARYSSTQVTYIFVCTNSVRRTNLKRVSVTRWLDDLARWSVQYLEQWKFAQKYEIFAQVGSQFSQIVNSYSRNGQILFKILSKWQNFAKSGHTPRRHVSNHFYFNFCCGFSTKQARQIFYYFDLHISNFISSYELIDLWAPVKSRLSQQKQQLQMKLSASFLSSKQPDIISDNHRLGLQSW